MNNQNKTTSPGSWMKQPNNFKKPPNPWHETKKTNTRMQAVNSSKPKPGSPAHSNRDKTRE